MDPGTSYHLYPAVIQAVLLFGAETGVVTPHIESLLGSFRYRVMRRLAGMQHQGL